MTLCVQQVDLNIGYMTLVIPSLMDGHRGPITMTHLEHKLVDILSNLKALLLQLPMVQAMKYQRTNHKLRWKFSKNIYRANGRENPKWSRE